MDSASDACGVAKNGPPGDLKKTKASSTADCSQEKPFAVPFSSSPRPARLASPASSCRGTPPPPRLAPSAAAGGRSVRSIVEWLEGPRQPESPPENNILGRKTTSTVSEASAHPNHHRPDDQSIAHAEDVEEYSLTYLNYKGFYLEAPLARCLDGVNDDLAKKPLEEVFHDAKKSATSGRTVVNVTSSAPSSPAAAGEKMSTSVGEDVEASKQADTSYEKPADLGQAKTSQATIAGNTGAMACPDKKDVSSIADAKNAREDHSNTVAIAENGVSSAEAAAEGDQGQNFVRRDPQEVDAF